MRRAHGAVVGALALLAAVVGVVVSGAVPARADAPRVFLLGDSVMAGLHFSSSALATLNASFNVTLDAKVCRTLLEPSCSTKYDGQPPAALSVLRANRGQLGDVVVMMVGYNDSGIGPKIDAIMGELESQGVPHVVWLTYRNPTGRYSGNNATLWTAMSLHPTLSVADWDSASAGHGDWFAGDGLHLTGAGANGLASFLTDAIDAALGGGGSASGGHSRAAASPVPARCALPVQGQAVALPTTTAPRLAAPAGYTSITPARVVDTRTSQPLGAGHALDVDLSKLVPAGASAAFVNLTAVDPCDPGFLTAYPCDGPVPLASNVNVVRATTAANFAAVLLAANGHMCVYSSVTTDVIVDASGWFAPGSGWRYQPVTPVRLVDTRGGTARLALTGSLAAGATLSVPISPWPGAPDAPVGVLVNVTSVDATGPGYFTVSPCGTATPVSTLNYDRGAVVSNMAVSAIGGDGSICVTSSAVTDVVVDLEGWFGSSGSLFVAQTPQRLTDTRASAGRVGAGGTLTVNAPAASGVLANITAVGPDGPGYLTAYPCGPTPTVSTVNYAAGAVVPGVAAVATSSSRFCVYTMAPTDVVVDVQGTFT